VPAGRPQKYQDRATICVSLEKGIKVVAQNLGIDFSKALTHGLHFLIDYQLKTTKNVDPAIISEWKRVKEQTLSELKAYLQIEQDKQDTLSTVLEERQVSEARLNEKIKVWDIDAEKYVVITRRQYNHVIHEIQGDETA